ncbi:MAG: WYL domain-containing protein [Bacteroidetes bacterium]|jgi:proteasome accessory factor C|nr:WYL domain-containing protein [Bacteroidota bacterium]MBT4401960.1 WYL domain-containing protein [Bacteroidota bacterium]MBT7466537.1 WYL domain-containing protein [Bacteroidota bacterium]
MGGNSSVNRQIKLLLILASAKWHSRSELTDRLQISERALYRYFRNLRECGVIIEQHDGRYRIVKIEKPIKDLSDLLHFSEEEAVVLKEAIHSVDDNNIIKTSLIRKLYALYDFDRVVETVIHRDQLPVIRNLVLAIREKKQIILRSYHSSHGNMIRDRMVEPFDLTTNYISVWAFDPESRTNKTFKTARIREVDVTDNNWQFVEKHEKVPIDAFRISGRDKILVKIKLSLRAYNLMLEEFPLAGTMIQKLDDTHYQFDGWVCSLEGIGRFVMGLCDEIEVVYPTELKSHIRKRIEVFDKRPRH